ncbi:hypothetical protein [Mycetocola miduiensis]|uniref:Antitoxin Xre/MbcA/ParS-like toxin-binding domain-containing protein n=1 Tax=Mycetocola miduiensis TaxID=995034 RepID=A0A1I4Z0B0_9MICO|nr:hypothetical protein [Mycetocola miduiensis]SFN43483.1 hypothetical protein SAMN05216219_0632 [Mycetocola miduiensis]
MTDSATRVSGPRVQINAHARSVELSVTDVAAALQEQLGQALLSVIVGRDTRTVARWVSGDVQPPQASEQRLRDTLQIMTLLTTTDAAPVARAWFMGMNPRLNDETPAEVLAEGRAREVLAAARAFINAA